MGDSVDHKRQDASRDLDDIRWEMEFYEDVLKRNPNYIEVLTQLGGLYTDTKMYEKGLWVDQRLALLKKDDPIIQYNLACSYSLLNQTEKALEALEKAIALGYCDLDLMSRDTDLDNIRSDPRYIRAVERIRRGKP